ncbi:unnamed protein product [Polarella glacialis]|uniref:BTB domain-containing protein n=1 Tax=Polarella glacialis TaxID=89957 RepID=A0A813KCC1_POLGL|nr:unnamed protein product [Polarella glacialis]
MEGETAHSDPQLSANLSALFQDLYELRGDAGDAVQFVVDGRTLDTCHAWIAGLHSQVICRMLSSQMREANTRQIQLTVADDIAVLPAIIRFFYGFTVEICGFDNAIQLLRCAEFYAIPQLKQQCSTWLGLQELTAAHAFRIIEDIPFDEFLLARTWSLLESSPGQMFQSAAWLECRSETAHAVLDRSLDCKEIEILRGAVWWNEHNILTNIEKLIDQEAPEDKLGWDLKRTAKEKVEENRMDEIEKEDKQEEAKETEEDVQSEIDQNAEIQGAEDLEEVTIEEWRSRLPKSEQNNTADDGDASDGEDEQLVAGVVVVVTKEFLSDTERTTGQPVAIIGIREVGCILRIDPDGDAEIRFHGDLGAHWVMKDNFCNLKAYHIHLASDCQMPLEAVLSDFDGLNFEESRWQWHKQSGYGSLMSAAPLPSTMLGKIRFEYMAPEELYMCKRFLPPDDYLCYLETASRAKPFARRSPRDKPASSSMVWRRCLRCKVSEQLAATGQSTCINHHPQSTVTKICEVTAHEGNSWSSPPKKMRQQSVTFACCGGNSWSPGCTPRQHEYETVNQEDKLKCG